MGKLNVMIRLVVITLLINCASLNLYGQTPDEESTKEATQEQEILINWLSFEEAMELQYQEKRKLFFEVYIESCRWCKEMEATTLQQPHIAQYINENYYAIKFDAEYKNKIQFKDKEYEFVLQPKKVGYHSLVDEFLGGKLMFPTLVFMDEELNLIQAISGFQVPEEFERIITYFGTDNYRKMPWSTYKNSYKSILETARE